LSVSVLEEIAYENRWITKEDLLAAASRYGKSEYGKHLKKVVEGKIVPHRDEH
jgi:glucose-1-phosphate thymidylyltransferase